ncbi:MAG: FtsX-like permease family protein [Candidatus Kariarchaeaceae archaeon]
MNIKEDLFTAFRIIKLNSKYTFVTMLGLIIGVGMLSHIVLYTYSHQYEAFRRSMDEEYAPSSQIELLMRSIDISVDTPDHEHWNDLCDQALEETKMTDKIAAYDWRTEAITHLGVWDYPGETTAGRSVRTFQARLTGLDQKNLDFLAEYIEGNGHLPTKAGEGLLVVKSMRFLHNNVSSSGGMYKLIIPPDGYLPYLDDVDHDRGYTGFQDVASNELTNTDINITGVVIAEKVQRSTYDNVPRPVGALFANETVEGVVMPITYAENVSKQIYYTHNYLTYKAQFYLNLEKIDSFDTGEEARNIKRLAEKLRELFLNEGAFFVMVTTDVIFIMEDFVEQFQMIMIILVLFAAPSIAISLFLIHYSFGLIKRRRNMQGSLLKGRGATRSQLAFYFGLEALIYSSASIVIGTYLGIPFTKLIGKTDSFLSFDAEPLTVAFSMQLFKYTATFGILITLLTMLPNIISLINMPVVESQKPIEKGLPIWQKYYFDVVLLGIGTAMWVIFRLARISGDRAFIDGMGLYLAAPSPIIMMTGAILVISRIFGPTIKHISNFLWRFEGGMLAFSFRNFLRRRKELIRGIIVITLTVTFAMISAILPVTLIQFDADDANYTLGADVVMLGIQMEPDALLDMKEELMLYPDIELVSPISMISIYSQVGAVTYQYTVWGIDTETYPKVVSIDRNEYGPWDNLTKFVQQIQENNSVFVQRNDLDDIGKGVGDEMIISQQIASSSGLKQVHTTLEIIDSFTYWPMLIHSVSGQTTHKFYVRAIGNLSLPYYLKSQVTGYPSGVMYIKVKENSQFTQSEIADMLESRYNKPCYSVDERLIENTDNIQTVMLYGVINSSFIVSMFVTVLTMLFYSVMSYLERRKEIGVLRAMGVKDMQLLTIFLSEIITMVTIGLVVGTGLGLLVSNLFMGVITLNNPYPPFFMVFPWRNIIMVNIAIFASSIIGGLIPTIRAASVEVGDILREEQ